MRDDVIIIRVIYTCIQLGGVAIIKYYTVVLVMSQVHMYRCDPKYLYPLCLRFPVLWIRFAFVAFK